MHSGELLIKETKKEFKSGFIAVIGRPNVGKSTLVNSVVGQKVAAVSNKPNTTRNRIKGIYNTKIIFTHKPRTVVNLVVLSHYFN